MSLVAILDASFSDYRPTFSPDGRRIVFERTPIGTGRTQLWIYDRDSGETRPFLEPGTGPWLQTRADWSFAGNDQVAFAGGGEDGPLSIWTVNGDGTGCQPVPDTQNMTYPAWYPDGEHLAVMVTRHGGPYIAKIDLKGSGGQITPDSIYTGMPSVNQADGRSLAFAGQPRYGQLYNQNNNNVWVFDPALPDAAPRLFNPGQGRAPWWSQDGSQIAFESSFQPDQEQAGFAIYVAPAGGGPARRLTEPSRGAQHPKWSKSGEEIVCALHPDPQSPFRIAILSVGT
jgi:Tol biopolymer transport system component